MNYRTYYSNRRDTGTLAAPSFNLIETGSVVAMWRMGKVDRWGVFLGISNASGFAIVDWIDGRLPLQAVVPMSQLAPHVAPTQDLFEIMCREKGSGADWEVIGRAASRSLAIAACRALEVSPHWDVTGDLEFTCIEVRS